jgi:transglutaminase-like putative cysteine protease
VCQDHAHVFIGAARLLGVPARYVSGYLLMDASTAQDAGHAWAEAHVPGLGWVGFDPSNEICPDSAMSALPLAPIMPRLRPSPACARGGSGAVGGARCGSN